MNLTVTVWLLLFFTLSIMSLKRPAYGVAVYMLSYFLCPPFWWWGDVLIGWRWNLYAGVILLVSVVTNKNMLMQWMSPAGKRACGFAIMMAVNATFVHFVLAENYEISEGSYVLLMKFILLFFMIVNAISSRLDLRIVMLGLLLGAGYIGFEVTINERGKIVANRLEGVGAPSAASANEFASLMVTCLPFTGVFLLAGNRWERLLMLPIAPFLVNTVLLCNSRGANLGAVFSAIVLLIIAPRKVRKQAILIVGLGTMLTWMLMGDPRILERFMTIFVSEEERDGSAQHRIYNARAGLEMVKDFPLGAGGNGFKRLHGPKYLKAQGTEDGPGAIHNGFINEACEWGVQGLIFRMGLVIGALLLALRNTRHYSELNDSFGALSGCSIVAGMSGFLVTCMFGDRLDNEWGYWVVALAVGHGLLTDALRHRAPDSKPEILSAGVLRS